MPGGLCHGWEMTGWELERGEEAGGGGGFGRESAGGGGDRLDPLSRYIRSSCLCKVLLNEALKCDIVIYTKC